MDCGPTGAYRVHDVKVYNKETGNWDDLDLKAKYNLAGYNSPSGIWATASPCLTAL